MTMFAARPMQRHQKASSGRYWYFDLASITLAFIIFAFPLSALFSALISSLWGINGDTFSVASRAITFLVAMLLFAKRTLTGHASVPSRALVVFSLIYMTRLGYDAFIVGNPAAGTAMYFFAIVTLVPTFALACVQPQDWNERGAILVSLIMGVIFIILAIWMLATGRGQEWIDQEIVILNGGRQSFERINPILLGHTAVTVILLAVSLVVNDASRTFKFALACIIVLSLYIVYLAASRGPILTLLVGLVVLCINNRRGLVISLICAACLVAMAVATEMDIEGFLRQMRFTSAGTDTNSIARIDYFFEGWDAFVSSPIIGASFEMPISGGWPHNVFIEVLMSMGLIGMAAFLALLLPALLRTFKAVRQGTCFAGILLVQMLVGMQFSGSLWGTAALWATMALVVSNGKEKSTESFLANNSYRSHPNNQPQMPIRAQR